MKKMLQNVEPDSAFGTAVRFEFVSFRYLEARKLAIHFRELLEWPGTVVAGGTIRKKAGEDIFSFSPGSINDQFEARAGTGWPQDRLRLIDHEIYAISNEGSPVRIIAARGSIDTSAPTSASGVNGSAPGPGTMLMYEKGEPSYGSRCSAQHAASVSSSTLR